MTNKRHESVDRNPADLLFGELDSLFGQIAKVYEGAEDMADYSALLADERFLGAPADIQERLRQKYGLPSAETASSDGGSAAGAEAAVRPEGGPEAGKPVRTPLEFPVDWGKEASAQNPHPRIFTGYRWDRGKDKQPILVEKGRVFDKKTKKYEEFRNPPVADVEFPEELLGRLDETEVRLAVIDFCSRLRKHLGEGGLSLYFDDVKDSDGNIEHWRPKWKYTLQEPAPGESKEPINEYLEIGATWETAGQKVEDPLSIPADIIALVEDNLRQALDDDSVSGRAYRGNPAYRNWYGKAIQAERDAIISRELAKQGFEKMPSGQKAEPSPDLPKAEVPDKKRRRYLDFAKAGRQAAKSTLSAETATAKPTPTEAPETKPEPGIETSRLLADAGPVIAPLLEAYEQIYEDDIKSQIREVVKACMTKLNAQYQAEGLIAKKDNETLVAFADDLVEEVKRQIAARQFRAKNPELSPKEFVPVGEDEMEMSLDTQAWRQTVMARTKELVAQAAAELDSQMTDSRKQHVAEALASVLSKYRETSYSRIDLEQGKLTLRNWSSLKKLIQRGLRPKGGQGPGKED